MLNLKLVLTILFLCILPECLFAQATNSLLVQDPRLDLALSYYENGLVDESKRMFIDIKLDPSAAVDIRIEARYMLGQIAYEQKRYQSAFDIWWALVADYPEHNRAYEVSRLMERIMFDVSLLEAQQRPSPEMFVRVEIDYGGIEAGRSEIKVKGIGVFFAKVDQVYFKFVELSNSTFWEGEERALVSSNELEDLERALKSITAVGQKWAVRDSQTGSATYTTVDGLSVGIAQELVPENPYRKDGPKKNDLVWFLMLKDKRIILPDNKFPENLMTVLREVDAMLEEQNPRSWWSDSENR